MCYSVLVEKDLALLAQHLEATVDKPSFDLLNDLTHQEPKRFKTVAKDGRIYPHYYTPVISQHGNTRLIRPMRYSAFPPSYMTEDMAKGLSTFNARRDTLGKRFWSEAVGKHHGILIARSFFEWVSVKDLIRAGRVTMDQVEAYFAEQSRHRRERVLASGKRYKPTATESKPPLMRDIVIEFSPKDETPMLVPVICSRSHDGLSWGFALITDEPTAEIRAAGHDRMPIQLAPRQVASWLNPEGMRADQIADFLTSVPSCQGLYIHDIARTAA